MVQALLLSLVLAAAKRRYLPVKCVRFEGGTRLAQARPVRIQRVCSDSVHRSLIETIALSFGQARVSAEREDRFGLKGWI